MVKKLNNMYLNPSKISGKNEEIKAGMTVKRTFRTSKALVIGIISFSVWKNNDKLANKQYKLYCYNSYL